MTVFLYSDKNYEQISTSCISSLKHKISDDVRIVYYTIGFDSDFEFRNLVKHRIEPDPLYPAFEFYKPELSLLTMELFPDDHYLFVDSDVVFSRRFKFDAVKHDHSYPLASFGPHEYIYSWVQINGEIVKYDETKLMRYFSVPDRTQRYVFSCFYSFNPKCKDFMEEWMSMCKNEYLLNRRADYFPFKDETSFNICLWKRGATENYRFGFVNTHMVSTVKEVEKGAANQHFDNAIDAVGAKWEYVEDSSEVMFYHGFKEVSAIKEVLAYLLGDEA
jgi:hypothetical protein